MTYNVEIKVYPTNAPDLTITIKAEEIPREDILTEDYHMPFVTKLVQELERLQTYENPEAARTCLDE